MTLEEGEIPEEGGDVLPLFAVDTTGDPDNFTRFSLPQPSPDVVFLQEVKRTVATPSYIGRGKTPMRTQRYHTPKVKHKNKGKVKNLFKAVTKKFNKKKEKHWTKHLEKVKSESNVARDDFGPRQVNLVPTANINKVTNPFFNGANAALMPGQLPPPSPATIINALHNKPPTYQTLQLQQQQQPQQPYHFQPNAPIRTDFASGVGHIKGGVYQFNANKHFPSMGVRQASRSALANAQKGAGMDNVYGYAGSQEQKQPQQKSGQ